MSASLGTDRLTRKDPTNGILPPAPSASMAHAPPRSRSGPEMTRIDGGGQHATFSASSSYRHDSFDDSPLTHFELCGRNALVRTTLTSFDVQPNGLSPMPVEIERRVVSCACAERSIASANPRDFRCKPDVLTNGRIEHDALRQWSRRRRQRTWRAFHAIVIRPE
jgi:hypothetical protein